MATKQLKEKKPPFYKRISLISVILVIVFIIGFTKGLNKSKETEAVSVIWDSGPCIVLSINGRGEVLSVVPQNDSAKDLLHTMNFADSSLSDIVASLSEGMAQQNILQDGAVLLSADGKIEEKNSRTMNDMENKIQEVLQKKGISCPIHKQDITKRTETVRNFAKENGISDGKAYYILETCKQVSAYQPTELAKLSVKELFALPKAEP